MHSQIVDYYKILISSYIDVELREHPAMWTLILTVLSFGRLRPYSSESCQSSHIISEQQYGFKVSFSNGASISGFVQAT